MAASFKIQLKCSISVHGFWNSLWLPQHVIDMKIEGQASWKCQFLDIGRGLCRAMFQRFKSKPKKNPLNERDGDTSSEEEEEEKHEEGGNNKMTVNKDLWNGDEKVPHAAELEARAAVKFSGPTFCKELFYHIFFPLSAPLMVYLDGGWLALVNRGFYSHSQVFLMVWQLFLAVCFFSFNTVSTYYMVGGNYTNFVYDILLVDILWIMRNSVVATKYAFASKVQMEKMRTVLVDQTMRRHMTLLGGWNNPLPRKILKEELFLAAVRCRMMLHASSFQLDTSTDSFEAISDMVADLRLEKDDPHMHSSLTIMEEANKWLQAGSEECLDAMALTTQGGILHPGRLPVHLYAAHVIHQSSSLSRLRRVGHTLLSQHLQKCAFGLSLAIAVLPIVGRFFLGGHRIPGPLWAKYTITVSSFFLMFFSMWSNVAFMMVGVLDFRRRHYVASKLDELLRTGVYTGSLHIRTPRSLRSLRKRSYEWLIRLNGSRGGSSSGGSNRSGGLRGQGIWIDFNDPDSLQAWWTCRMLVHDFGLGFHKRIKYYTTYFACYCLILIGFVALRLITGIKRDDIYFIVTVIASLDVFLTLLALMVWPGGDINMVRQMQGATLTYRKLRLQMQIQEDKTQRSSEELKKEMTAIQTMASITEAVKWDNGKHKVSVCGFQAGEQLISVIVAILTATISIGVGQIVTRTVGA